MEYIQWKSSGSLVSKESEEKLDKDPTHHVLLRFNDGERKTEKFDEKMELASEEFDFNYKVYEGYSSATYANNTIETSLNKAMEIFQIYLTIMNT